MQDIVAGALLGLFIALPPGPVSLNCLRNAILHGPLIALASCLGAATAHAIFAFSAGLAARSLAAAMAEWGEMLSVGSAGLLILLGVMRLRRSLKFGAPAPASGRIAPVRTYGIALALALSNPMTVLPYLAFATSVSGGVLTDLAPDHAALLALGAAAGASVCYFCVTSAALLARRSLKRGVIDRLDFVSGMALVGFGCMIVAQQV